MRHRDSAEQTRLIERMRIEGQSGESMATAYLWLTPEEAKELMDTLGQLLAMATTTPITTSRPRISRQS